jgi:putative heme-binding domain-containing protein
LLATLCRATEPGARAYAASVVGAWAGRLTNALELLRPLVADENPRVRLQAIVACTYLTNAAAMETAAVAADFPTDKFIDYALKQAVFALKPQWLPAFRAGRLNLEDKPDRVAMLVRADGSSDVVETLRSLLQSAQTTSAASETYWRILADVGDANDLAAMLRIDEDVLQARLLPVLGAASRARRVRPAGNLVAALEPLVQSGDASIGSEALKLAGLWKLESFRPFAQVLALNLAAQEAMRRAAAETLGGLGGEVSRVLLLRLAITEPAPRVRAAAINALSVLDADAGVGAAATFLSRAEDESAVSDVFTALLQRQGGAELLADALDENPPNARAADIGLRIVNVSGLRDESLAQVLAHAAGFKEQNFQMTAKEIEAFAAEVRAKGDLRRGAEIFQRPQLGCVACHAVHGHGGNIGPNLSALGSAQPIDFIIGAILDPQKEIKEGFTAVVVTTKDGEEHQGYALRETRNEIVIRDVLQNKEVRLPRDAIAEKRQLGSVMPDGLADTLTRDDFRDLVRYLSELGRTK